VRRVTLEQLLSHTSGLRDDEAFLGLVDKATLRDGNLDEMRAWLVEQRVKSPLGSGPPAKFAYSNLGYVVAGVILERKAGKTWEELVTQRVFTPLGLGTAGLGPQ